MQRRQDVSERRGTARGYARTNLNKRFKQVLCYGLQAYEAASKFKVSSFDQQLMSTLQCEAAGLGFLNDLGWTSINRMIVKAADTFYDIADKDDTYEQESLERAIEEIGLLRVVPGCDSTSLKS